uniref:Actin-associated protein FAM107A n=1 Tax=Myotis myotis TaxID=51298 RepID=A0A7J7UCC7_MYOMY|nr:family with sequence similarity 107 member A [Myotis myotis]
MYSEIQRERADIGGLMARPEYREWNPELIKPKKLLNPVKASRSHQELHRELLMNHRRSSRRRRRSWRPSGYSVPLSRSCRVKSGCCRAGWGSPGPRSPPPAPTPSSSLLYLAALSPRFGDICCVHACSCELRCPSPRPQKLGSRSSRELPSEHSPLLPQEEATWESFHRAPPWPSSPPCCPGPAGP